MNISNKLLTLEETIGLIENGNVLIVASEEDLLRQLPKGNWIGGSIPYFMSDKGGCFDKNKLFVTDITTLASDSKIATFSVDNIADFTKDNYDNGIDYIIIPGFSDIHSHYAIETQNIPDLFQVPVFGWISGIDLNDIGKKSPVIVDGSTLTVSSNKAVVLYVEVPEDITTELNIINIFEQNEDGDSIIFTSSGFEANNCIINGEYANLFDYIKDKNIDTKLPLVANYSGASINISIQALEEKSKTVKLYAPIHEGIEYKFAKPVEDYINDFTSNLKTVDSKNITLSCNCILNYLYSELEGKMIEGFNGPFTFGEIAYILVNQTLVYVSAK